MKKNSMTKMKPVLSQCLVLFIYLTTATVFGEDDEHYPKEESSKFKPTLLSSPTTNYVDLHDSITLTCEVDKLDVFALMWKKNNKIFNIDDKFMYKGNGIKFDVNKEKTKFSLIIDDVTEKLLGDYSCFISHSEIKDQIHSIRLHGQEPTVEPTTKKEEMATPEPTKKEEMATPEPTKKEEMATPEPTKKEEMATPEPTGKEEESVKPEPTLKEASATTAEEKNNSVQLRTNSSFGSHVAAALTLVLLYLSQLI